MSFRYRPANDDEMSQFGNIAAYVYAGAFGDGPDNIVSQSNRPEWTLCAFDGKTMAASFATIPFTMRAAGKALAMGGISAVGTLPEYRRRGLMRELMSRSLASMHYNGVPVAALWASQAAIYQRYQFAMTTVRREYSIDTVDIAFHDGDSGNCTVRRAPISEAFDVLKRLYIAFVDQRMCYLHRASALWQLTVLQQNDAEGPVHVAVAHDGEQPAGYVIYTVRSGKMKHEARGQELRIRDLVWLTPDAYRSIWRFLASHDLVGRVFWPNAALDDPAPELLVEPRLLHLRDTEGCWFRIVDVASALAGRGYTHNGDGALSIAIEDDPLTPWNQGTWRLEIRDGEAAVEPAGGGGDIRTSIKALTSLFTGFRSASTLSHWGLLSGDRDAIATADRLFRTPHAPHCPDNF